MTGAGEASLSGEIFTASSAVTLAGTFWDRLSYAPGEKIFGRLPMYLVARVLRAVVSSIGHQRGILQHIRRMPQRPDLSYYNIDYVFLVPEASIPTLRLGSSSPDVVKRAVILDLPRASGLPYSPKGLVHIAFRPALLRNAEADNDNQ